MGEKKMIITIDPGIDAGYSIWNDKWNLIKYGIILGKGKNWEEKMQDVAKKLKALVMTYGATKGFIEEPKKYHGTFGNMVADRGDLVKLSIQVGYIKGYLGIPVESIPVILWKGQLPKDVVIKRIKRLLPKAKATSHDWDAIGIGLFLAGKF